MPSPGSDGRSNLLDYLSSTNVRHRREVEAITKARQRDIIGATAALKARHKSELAKLTDNHSAQVKALQEAHREKIQRLQFDLDACKLDVASYKRRFEKAEKLRLEGLQALRAAQKQAEVVEKQHVAALNKLKQKNSTLKEKCQTYGTKVSALSSTETSIVQELDDTIDENAQLKQMLAQSQTGEKRLQKHLQALEQQCSGFQARLDIFGFADTKIRQLSSVLTDSVNELLPNTSADMESSPDSNGTSSPELQAHGNSEAKHRSDRETKHQTNHKRSSSRGGNGTKRSERHRRTLSRNKFARAGQISDHHAAQDSSRKHRKTQSSSSASHTMQKQVPLEIIVTRMNRDLTRILSHARNLDAQVRTLSSTNRTLELEQFNLKNRLAGKSKIATLMKFKLMKVAGNRAALGSRSRSPSADRGAVTNNNTSQLEDDNAASAARGSDREVTDSPADFGVSEGDEFDFRLLQKDLEANLREQLRRENYERLADAMGMEDLERGWVLCSCRRTLRSDAKSLS